MSQPFYFLIPLRSAQVTKDWDLVSTNLHRTLKCLVNQTDQRFGIVLACHEVPEFLTKTPADADDRRIAEKTHIISALDVFDPPTGIDGYDADKSYKKRAMGAHLKAIGADGVYVMHFDADDLLRDDLVASVLSSDNKRGYLITRGYMFNAMTGDVALCDEAHSVFWRHCGSCAVLHFGTDDFPDDLNDRKALFSLFKSHTTYADVSLRHGKQLEHMTGYFGLYLTNHGENNRIHKGKGATKEQYVRRFRTSDRARLTELTTRFPHLEYKNMAVRAAASGPMSWFWRLYLRYRRSR